MPVHLFVYGSLVSPTSLGATIGYVPPADRGPAPAMLRDYVREWNVGSDRESHPERVLLAEDGTPFTGTLAVLGLRRSLGSRCNGAIYALDEAVVDSLNRRERNYRLVEVTVHVVAPPESGTRRAVLTFVPRTSAVERLRLARRAGTAVVRAGYQDLVGSAFRSLGPGQEEAFARLTLPHDLPVRRIVVDGEG